MIVRPIAGLFFALLLAGTAGAEAQNAMNGIASVYGFPGDKYAGSSKTASGERFNPGHLTAAHRTLPFGTMVRVTHKKTGRSVVVRINDRGPFIRGRVIDLSPKAAAAVGFSGLAPVTLTLVHDSERVATN
ncbi:septal ring lytic transglycosylase RlpA family protein [Pseudorhodoplanes sp.]|uniref:septal ring lytic transglycosylase RlpA family protein n=1 Tax=Pseudorhodoplanes sp. TaxID=1934341 RepID=UPI003D0A984F